MTTKRITSVSPILLQEMREKWLAIGLRTGPTDWGKAHQAIIGLMQSLQLKVPSIWVHLGNPLDLVAADRLLRAKVYAQVDDQVSAQVYAKVHDQVYAKVDDQVRAKVYAQVDDQVSAQVRAKVYAEVDAKVCDEVDTQVCARVRSEVDDQVYAQVCAEVDAKVYAQVDAQVSAQVRAKVYAEVDAKVYAQVDAQVSDQVYAKVHAQVYAKVYAKVRAQVHAEVDTQVDDQVRAIYPYWYMQGQYLASLCAWWDAYGQMGLDISRARPLMALAEHVSWWLPLGDICLICPHPSSITLDQRGRLHGVHGPALSYPDGWSVYAWHGVRVPQDAIEHPERLVAANVLRERNAETKRTLMEIMGAERFFGQLQPQVIHQDDDLCGNPRRLLRLAMPDTQAGHVQAVQVTCPSTARVYVLPVQPTVRTCAEAVASTFQRTAAEYAPVVEQ